MTNKFIIQLFLVSLLFQVSQSFGQSSNSQVLGSSLTTEQVKFLEKNFCLVENGDEAYSKNEVILSISKLRGSIYEVELTPKTKFKNLGIYLPENKKIKAQITSEDDKTIIMTIYWNLKNEEYRTRYWLTKTSFDSFTIESVLSTYPDIGMKSLNNLIFQECSHVISANQNSTLLLTSNLEGKLYIDGELKGGLVKDTPRKIRVIPGEHIIKAVSMTNDKIKWATNTSTIEGIQKIVAIDLQLEARRYQDKISRLKYEAMVEKARHTRNAEIEKARLEKEEKFNELAKTLTGSWNNVHKKRYLKVQYKRKRHSKEVRDITRSLSLNRIDGKIRGAYKIKFTDNSNHSKWTETTSLADIVEVEDTKYLVYYFEETRDISKHIVSSPDENEKLKWGFYSPEFLLEDSVLCTMNSFDKDGSIYGDTTNPHYINICRKYDKYISIRILKISNIQSNSIVISDQVIDYTFYKEN